MILYFQLKWETIAEGHWLANNGLCAHELDQSLWPGEGSVLAVVKYLFFI